jgi:shikimate kinase
MQTFGARISSISGKGPTVFGIFDSLEDLEVTKNILKKQYPSFFIKIF